MQRKRREVNDDVSLHVGGCCCHEQHFHYWCILCPHIHEGYCLGVPSRNYCLSPHSGCNSDDDAELEAPALDACVCSFFFLPTRFGSYVGPGEQVAHGLRLGIWSMDGSQNCSRDRTEILRLGIWSMDGSQNCS